MKQLYLLLTACLCLAMTVSSQTTYWTGASGGAWNNSANWSLTTNGTGGAAVPNGNTFDVIIDKNVSINVNLANITLNSLSVTGSSTVRLYTATNACNFTLSSTSTATPAITIASGATLEDSASAGNDFLLTLANNAMGVVDGTWSLHGTTSPSSGGAVIIAQGGPSFTNHFTVNGTLKVGKESLFQASVADYAVFTNTGTLELAGNGGNIPRAIWDAGSTLLLTGIEDVAPVWATPVTATGFGNIVVDCQAAIDDIYLNLPANLLIKGDLTVVNTNNQQLVLGNGVVPGTKSYTLNGNLEVNDNCYVSLGGIDPNNGYSLQVGGNVLLSGGTFDLHSDLATVTQPTTLHVRGNIIQTGTAQFICSNNTVSTSSELLVVELNGTTPQEVSIASGTIDNASHQVVLRLNNSLGATLQSGLQVGKISWNTAGKGVLTAPTGNYLYVANASASDPLVVNGASASGFVAGTIRRAVAASQYISFPTGQGSSLRACEIKPIDAAPSVYEAEYVSGAYSSLAVTAPLTAVSNQEYWNIAKISGSDAAVRLTLAGAVPGATANDTLVVAHYSGGNWQDVRGTKLTPGNSTAGSVESADLSTFSPFTFGYTSFSALPIYLTSFTGRQERSTTVLNWTITDNSTPQAFEIQRSVNGSGFTGIGMVQGEERKLNYTFTDTRLPSGNVYYRLRMIDIDGSAEFSRIVTIMNGSKGVLLTAMMPTIVANRSRLQITSSDNTNIEFVVTDLYGRTVHRQVNGIMRGNQEIWLNVANLSNGTYQVTGYVRTGEKTSTIRFIKQ